MKPALNHFRTGEIEYTKIRIGPGETISDAFLYASELSDRTDAPVRFEFNGEQLEVKPGAMLQEWLVLNWYPVVKRRFEAEKR